MKIYDELRMLEFRKVIIKSRMFN